MFVYWRVAAVSPHMFHKYAVDHFVLKYPLYFFNRSGCPFSVSFMSFNVLEFLQGLSKTYSSPHSVIVFPRIDHIYP